MGPVDVPVGSSIAIVGTVDITAGNVMVLMFAPVGENACTGQFPLAQKEGFGRVCRVDVQM